MLEPASAHTARIVILGNSGSGKSTLAAELSRAHQCPTLDLDTVYWEPDQPGVARPLAAAIKDARAFCAQHVSWIVEGCYENVIAALLALDPELLFLDPGAERCVANCQSRPWEPHKYASKQQQDEMLTMLLDWVRAYYSRTSEMSHHSHAALFESYTGQKRRLR